MDRFTGFEPTALLRSIKRYFHKVHNVIAKTLNPA